MPGIKTRKAAYSNEPWQPWSGDPSDPCHIHDCTCNLALVARTIDRQTEENCLPVWVPGMAWRKSAQRDMKARNIWPHSNHNFLQ